jgi:acyl-coenzyme A synthetase/AMP-(fatty) acid ligase
MPELRRIIVEREQYKEHVDKRYYLDYHEEMAKVSKSHDAVPVSGDHPFYILYTSGTTG